MESTRVYSEKLAYFLVSNKFNIVIETHLKVKRDKIDSKQIAEYAFRFIYQLSLWTPKSEIVEQIRIFLNQRE
jgi:transposase